MVKNYISIAFRTLLKERWFSIINIFGLAIGLAAFWMIQHYTHFERSYENFAEDADNIYRVRLDVFRNGEEVFTSSENYPGAGPALKEELPEVLEYGRLYNMGSKNSVVISWEQGPNGPVTLKQKKFLYSDPTILSLFSYEMVKGNRDEALGEPFTLVISESMAKKYFGNEEPIGKLLRLQDDDFNDELCKVTGVYKDSPRNTHLKFDVLISYATLYARDDGSGWTNVRYRSGWKRKDFYTYIKVAPGTDPKALEAKFPAIVNKNKPELVNGGGEDILKLQPLRDIHLTSRLTDEAEVNGSETVVFYLSIVSWFILVIAWINYVNLSTAKAVNRAKEVGLRKVMGSKRGQLIFQFLTESLVINFISVIIAMVLLLVTLPIFSNMVGMPEGVAFWTTGWFWASAGILLITGSILAGVYPAFVLSSFTPIATIKGKFKNSDQGTSLRKALVTVQFAASISLIIGTGIVYSQMSHMQNQDLGFDGEQILVIQRPAVMDTSFQEFKGDYTAFKNGVKSLAAVDGFASTLKNPGTKLRFKTNIRSVTATKNESNSFGLNIMDYEFMDIMGMELIAGRSFSKEFPNDQDTSVMINETGARALGYLDPAEAVGKTVVYDQWDWRPKVIGVIKDYHQESLKEEIIPITYIIREFGNEYYMVKLKTDNLNNTLDQIEEKWAAAFTNNPMDYFFLDEYFNSYYKAERQFQNMFLFFSLMAIFVGCLGLFGLSLFNTVQRAKEIGIRKVLGASVPQIITLLVSGVMKLILISNLIAWPLVYLMMNNWLENYPYRTEINLWLFAGATILVLLIALLTVVSQSLKSAQTNPAEVLKYE